MKVVCAAPTCKYSCEHENSSNIIFVSFPNDDTATVWAHHCGRPDLMMKSNEDLHFNYYICSDHIEERHFLSKTNQIIITQGAIPTLFGLQMHTSRPKDGMKSPYESINVMNPLELSSCQSNYVDANDDYQSTMYNANSTSDNNEIDINKSGESSVQNNLNFDNINVNIEEFNDVTMGFANSCRICGKNMSDGINIFNNTSDGITIHQKIQIHLPISVEDGDVMPQKICGDCHGKLETSHRLVMVSLENDMRLRKIFNLPSKYNNEDKFRSLIEKQQLLITEEELLNGIAAPSDIPIVSGDSQLNNNPDKHEQNDEDSRLRYVLHSDLNNLILQPLQLSSEVRMKLAVESNDDETRQIKSTELNNQFAQCDEQPVLNTTDSTAEITCIVLNNKPDNSHQNPLKSKSRELNRRCGHCSLSFPNRKQLQIHITENHKGKGTLFKCGICHKTYEKWSSLDVHEATHRPDKPYLCDLCGKSFKHSNNLRGHKRVHLDVTRKKRHVCKICGDAFRSRFHLREHMNQHDGNKPYVCEQCGKAFSKRIQLRQHRFSHGVNKYSCTICGMTFNRRGNMNTHFKRHSSNDGAYTCSVCECRCNSMSELKTHRKQHSENDILESIKRKSTGKTIMQCNICQKIFSKRALLLNHERAHDGDDIKIQCNECGKKLASESSLRHHTKSIHQSENLSRDLCDNEFLNKELSLLHGTIHDDETPYCCSLCNSQYKCSRDLREHMKKHNVKQYACQYCSKPFSRKNSLTIHEREHSEQSFVCSICNIVFSKKNEMMKHERSHEFDEVFECEKCGEKFTKRNEILKHLDYLHKTDLKTPDDMEQYTELSKNFDNYSLTVPCQIAVSDNLNDHYT